MYHQDDNIYTCKNMEGIDSTFTAEYHGREGYMHLYTIRGLTGSLPDAVSIANLINPGGSISNSPVRDNQMELRIYK